MAQKTAFLNSDAPSFNKDYHHTMILDYLLNNAWVMFSNLVTKPEFTLWDNTISSGSAVVKCTKTAWPYTGESTLSLFQSTTAEPIDTTGNKKIFIEIPDWFVNDPTTITEAVTTGLNLNIGSIKSEATYPTHTNYIPLWEVTWGDWANAVDVRPTIRKFGRKNSLVYFDDNWVEYNIDLTSDSIGKYLMSNWPGNAPTLESASAWLEVPTIKERVIAWEDLLEADALYHEKMPNLWDANYELALWDSGSHVSRSFKIIWNGGTSADITLVLANFWAAADNVTVRIEWDNLWKPDGALIDVDAHGSLSWWSIGSTLSDKTISFASSITIPDWLVCHVVISRSWWTSATNYYTIGVAESRKTRSFIQNIYNWSTWATNDSHRPYIELDSMHINIRCKASADYYYQSDVTGFCQQNTSIWQEFVQESMWFCSLFTGLNLTNWLYYLSDVHWAITQNPSGAEVYVVVWTAISDTTLRMYDHEQYNQWAVTVWSQWQFDTIDNAIRAGAKYMYVTSDQVVNLRAYWVEIKADGIRITFNDRLSYSKISNARVSIDLTNDAMRTEFYRCSEVHNIEATHTGLGKVWTYCRFVDCTDIRLQATQTVNTNQSSFINCSVNLTSTWAYDITVWRASVDTNGSTFTLNTSTQVKLSNINWCGIGINTATVANLKDVSLSTITFNAGLNYELNISWNSDNIITWNTFGGNWTYTSQNCVVKWDWNNDRVMFCNNIIKSRLKFEDINKGMLCNNMAVTLVASTWCSEVTEVNNSDYYA